jgi:type I restriction enzyme S subunit
MSRGRKPKSENTNLNWQDYFNKNVGVYIQSIIIELGQLKTCGNESGKELLQEIKKLKPSIKDITLPQIRTEEIPFEIPDNWVWCRLGEIIDYTDNLNIETKFSKETLINYVDIDAIDNKNYKIRENKLKPVSELSSRARRVLRKGYIVYSLVRPYLNNIAIIEEEQTNHIGSTGFAVFNGIIVNNKYLKYILLSDYIRQLFLSMLSGFNSPTITQEQFNSTLIPLPPLSEQNLILEFLSDLENESIETSTTYFNGNIEKKIVDLHNSYLLSSDLFSILSDQLTHLENLNQAILQEAVQGKLVTQDTEDEPASELLKRIKAEKAKSGKKEKPLTPIKAEEIPFEIPKSWVWCRLGEMFDIERGSSPRPKGDPRYFSKLKTPFNWITISDMTAFAKDAPLSDTREYLTELGTKHSRYVTTKDIIIVASGSAGRTSLLGIDGFIYDGLMSVKNIEFDEMRIFLYYLFRVLEASMMKVATGATWQNINTDILKNQPIPLPPLSEQKRIVVEIEKQLSKTKQLKEHIIANQKATEQLLKALLHQAFEVEEME